MKNGEIYHIDFGGNKGSEINNIHLGIVFTIPKVKNMVFCIPLTSPKQKHFNNILSFDNRNHNELKYQNLVYIDMTDSIALLDQIKCISTQRLINSYNNIVLDSKNMNLIITKVNKFISNIMKNKK